MSGGYKKVSKDDVYRVIASAAVDIMNPFCGLGIKCICDILKTSKYQAKKHINELRRQGMVVLAYESVPFADELYPPYCFYSLTDKGKDTEIYREEEKRMSKIIKECFED